MAMESRGDVADVVVEVGRHWGLLLTIGIITAVIGVLTLIWPGRTIVVVAVLFGIQLILAGLFRFVAALASDDESGGTRVLYAVLGILSLIAGLYALRHLFVTIAVLALLLGIFWIVNGVVDIIAAVGDRGMRGRGWSAALGVLSIVAGVIVLMSPSITLLTLAVVLGIWLVVLGIGQVVLAFQLRSKAPALAAAIVATP